MSEAGSQRTLAVLAVVIVGAAILVGVFRFAGSDPDPARRGPFDEMSGADPATAPVPENRGDPGSLERGARSLSKTAGLSSEEERRLQDLVDARAQWAARHAAALAEFQRLNRVPLEERDRKAVRDARRRVQEEKSTPPILEDFLPGLTPGQEAAIDSALQQPEQRRNGDPDADGPESPEDFQKARRTWQVQNRVELAELRLAIKDARGTGDTASEVIAQAKLDELLETQPTREPVGAE